MLFVKNTIVMCCVFVAIMINISTFVSCDLDNMNLDIDSILNTLNEPVKDDNFEGNKEDNIDFASLVDQFLDVKPGEKCQYKCPNGKIPSVNPLHTPTSNGCGTKELPLDTSRIPEITKCCDAHDFCYDTCNSDKNKCDDTFKTCLQNICGKIQTATGINKQDIEWCNQLADTFHSTTELFGCHSYKISQANACLCDSSHDDLTIPSSKSSPNRQKRTPLDIQLDEDEPSELEDFDSPMLDAPDIPKEDDEEFEKMMRLLKQEL